MFSAKIQIGGKVLSPKTQWFFTNERISVFWSFALQFYRKIR